MQSFNAHRFIKKDAAVNVSVASKAIDRDVDAVRDRIEDLRSQIAEEDLCFTEVSAFAARNEAALFRQATEWQSKYVRFLRARSQCFPVTSQPRMVILLGTLKLHLG